jgi:chemotaxis methyl-accepting protein methylase
MGRRESINYTIFNIQTQNMNDEQFRLLLDYLGYSWDGYRRVRKSVKKRIRRHMQQLGCRQIQAYLDLLMLQAQIRQECEMLMTVSISRFFRDRYMWRMLEVHWLPGMLDGDPESFRIWSAGCACGEEVYTIKMVWERLRNASIWLPPLSILATDRSPARIARARLAIYNRSSLKEVSTSVRAAFFETLRGGRQYAVKDRYKTDINWEIRNLLTEPSDRRFQIIFLRNNILTYCRQAVHMEALVQILNSLVPGGLLILGRHERLPHGTAGIKPMDECPFAYRKS